MTPGYRWVILAVGVLAQASAAAVLQGLPGLAPQLRDEYGLTLSGLGVVLASVTLGLVSTLLLWGALADRYGERRIMTVGLVLAATSIAFARRTTTLGQLVVCLVLAGAAGASVNAASGRSVIGWFGPSERGFAMGVRQTALPLGAGLAAAVLPPIAARGGLDAAFGVLIGSSLTAALVVAVFVREAPMQKAGPRSGPSPMRDPRLRRLGAVSLLLVIPQFAIVAFLVVYLHDEHDIAVTTAALLLAGVQFGGGAGRILAGRWADRIGLRIGPLRRLAVVITGLFGALAVLAAYGGISVVPVVLVAGVAAISWNGLAFTAVGELAGPGKAGTALGFQNTAVAVGAALTPPLLGLTVEATAWAVAFGLAGLAAGAAVLLLGPLARTEHPHPSSDLTPPPAVV